MVKIKRTREVFWVRKTVVAFIAAMFLFAFLLPSLAGCSRKQTEEESYKIKEAELTLSDELALKTYDYNDLSETVVTMRADTMYVTERGIKRPEVKILPDSYSLSADKTSGGKYENNFVFDKGYPTPGHSIVASMFADKVELGVSKEQYLKYYRYMLHSQGYNLTRAAELMSAKGELTQENLYKHPAIDACYGEVEGTDNAVEKVVIIDPTYRSYHVTGLYLPAGEAVTVKVEGLRKGKRIAMLTGMQNSMAWRSGVDGGAITSLGCTVRKEKDADDNYFYNNDIIAAAAVEKPAEAIPAIQIHPHLAGDRYQNRLPWIRSRFTFEADGEYTIGSPFGGLILIDPSTSYNDVKFTIRGAVETPHYVLGVTTPEYFDEYLKDAPGVYSILDTENGQLIGPSSYMRSVTVEEIDKLAMLWHSFFSINETFTGGTHDRKNFVKFDYCVPAGAAVALGNYEYACPSSWYGAAMNYQGLLKGGTWGILHEIGHNHGAAFGSIWGFGEPAEGEVRNNALTCLAYLKILDIGTYRDANGYISAEHGFVAHPYSNLKSSLAITGKADFKNYDYFQMLSMYVNLMHSFGVDKYYELLKTYKSVLSYSTNKRADFIFRCALVYGLDCRKYFNEQYKANVDDSAFTEEQLEYISSLETYQPIANLYAGGIDGLHTGGDWRLNFGKSAEFDLKNTTISTGGFEIVSVSQPETGKLKLIEDGKYEYEFASRPYTRDKFSFNVRLENGQLHRLDVTLRINVNVAEITHYSGLAARDLDAAQAELGSLTPNVYSQLGGGVASFYNAVAGKNDVKISRFGYRASESGKHTFYFKADDMAVLKAGASFDSLEEKLRIKRDVQSFTEENKFSVNLSASEIYCFEIFNLNAGGKGFAEVNVFVGDGETAAESKALNLSGIYYPATVGQTVPENYVFEPEYLVSKKSELSLGSVSSPKSEWSILEAPDHHNSNTESVKFYDEVTGEFIDERIVERKSYLIDGQLGTIYHTAYAGSKPNPVPKMPHVFVLDTGVSQGFNFFQITTRNNANSYIRAFELFISEDNENWKLVASGADGADGKENTWLKYDKQVARLEFPEVHGRYWKLVVNSTSGGAFTVISELDTGVTAETQRVIPLTNSDLFATSGWKDSRRIENMQSGLLVAKKKKEKLVLRFKGESLSLYANKGIGYGSAEVYIDGEKAGKIDLNAEESAKKRLVFSHSGMANKEHTVEIITLTNQEFNLCFAGMSYTAQLLNAPNIYKEKALAITITVFVLLFALLATFIVLSFCLPKFRKAIYGNKVMRKYDEKVEKAKEEKARAKAENADKSEKKVASNEKTAEVQSASRKSSDTVEHRQKSAEKALSAKAPTNAKHAQSRENGVAAAPQPRPAERSAPKAPSGSAARPEGNRPPARPAPGTRPAAPPTRSAPKNDGRNKK